MNSSGEGVNSSGMNYPGLHSPGVNIPEVCFSAGNPFRTKCLKEHHTLHFEKKVITSIKLLMEINTASLRTIQQRIIYLKSAKSFTLHLTVKKKHLNSVFF